MVVVAAMEVVTAVEDTAREVSNLLGSCFPGGRGGWGSVQWYLILHITSVCEASVRTGSLCDISGYWFCLWLTGRKTPSC